MSLIQIFKKSKISFNSLINEKIHKNPNSRIKWGLIYRDLWSLSDNTDLLCYEQESFAGRRWISHEQRHCSFLIQIPSFPHSASRCLWSTLFLAVSYFAFYLSHARAPKKFWILLPVRSRPCDIVTTLLILPVPTGQHHIAPRICQTGSSLNIFQIS